MKPFSYYNSTIIWPNKTDYTVYYYYRQGKLICMRRPFSEDLSIPRDATEEAVFDEKSFEMHKQKYFEELDRIKQEFKKDLLEHYGLLGHKAANECFLFATRYGEVEGYEGVFQIFGELTKLLLQSEEQLCQE
jgi:predicted secreted protein